MSTGAPAISTSTGPNSRNSTAPSSGTPDARGHPAYGRVRDTAAPAGTCGPRPAPGGAWDSVARRLAGGRVEVQRRVVAVAVVEVEQVVQRSGDGVERAGGARQPPVVLDEPRDGRQDGQGVVYGDVPRLRGADLQRLPRSVPATAALSGQ